MLLKGTEGKMRVSSTLKFVSHSALMMMLLTGLAGCGGSEELKLQLEHDNSFTVLNGLDYPIDFYLQHRTMSTTSFSALFADANRVIRDIPQGAVSQLYHYRYSGHLPATNLGARSSINQVDEAKLYRALQDKENLWLAVWRSKAQQPQLTIIPRQQREQAGKINVRVFADDVYQMTINSRVTASTRKGEVSDFYALENCANALVIDGKPIDVCNADFGASYLLLLDEKGKKLLARE
jgi:hypothetical protein